MVGHLLAPYHDSMRLGQGFNSFLQEPRLNNAVHVVEEDISTTRGKGGEHVSQVVAYTSRFIERISDVVRSMNLSAGSSIKKGTIEVSGNSLGLDETKFASSDLNALVSVKVINQTTQLHDNAQFNPIDGIAVDSDEFHQIYGDCYISGFIEGGELHGVVSIKVLDVSKKHHIEQTIKGQINNVAKEFTLSSDDEWSALDSSLSQTETTISVNWSGGGQIKPDSEEWSINTLFKVAAGFPARVAQTPQRSWAILTKYDSNRDFVRWAKLNALKIKHYHNVQQYTSDLLDNYMEWKNNLARIQDVLANPSTYQASAVDQAIEVSVDDLVSERKKMKKQMANIVEEIDKLDKDPQAPMEDQESNRFEAPEVWATRLPVRKQVSDSRLADFQRSWLEGFNFQPSSTDAKPTTPTEPTTSTLNQPSLDRNSPLIDPHKDQYLTDKEKAYVTKNKTKFNQNYRFDIVKGSPKSGDDTLFADTEDADLTHAWPTRFRSALVQWGQMDFIACVSLDYAPPGPELTHHGLHNPAFDRDRQISLNIEPDEKICKVVIGASDFEGPFGEGVGAGWIVFIAVETTKGQFQSLGNTSITANYAICTPPEGFVGLKGFRGEKSKILNRLGVIWGRE
ncbi:hypothetical protein FN846DRAFT_992263 [Sphaerosporella brunnea]|uniref:Uncharacterized protein n=1 Tax=Sphaerosporella brunnea TaxID=1250544 RepID=A0A5J5ENE1_9PEZI|nr:hypothetical protein FN846DRAFT_992263 [Sphaerosporella brunnea]